MTTDDVYEFFGSGWKASCAIGITKSAFSAWIKRGYIPLKQQIRIQKITKGKLIALEKDAKKSLDKTNEPECTYLPNFRYYDKKHGMCRVESLHFRKGKPPKITYVVEGNNTEKFASFNTENLMQACDLVDCEGKTLYEGDICLLSRGRKFTFKSIDMRDKLDIIKFIIIGNIFE